MERSIVSSDSLALQVEAELEKLKRWIRKLWEPVSLEALRYAFAFTREMDEGVRGVLELRAGAMLADLPADVVRIDSQRTVGW